MNFTMKKTLFFTALLLCTVISKAQNIPAGAVLVPGTKALYVAAYDEPSKMMRAPAICACAIKGDGWRLPTVNELQIIYSHRYEMDFAESTYWTGEKVNGDFRFYALNFRNGKLSEAKFDRYYFVRCVWTSTPPPYMPGTSQPQQQNY